MQVDAHSLIGIVTGLAAEARIAASLGTAKAGGGQPAGAEAAAETLAAAGARALLSFGLAGGLDPDLAPGSLLVPAAVRDGDVTFATADSLREALGAGAAATLLAASGPVAGAGYKSILFQTTGAAAVDLESGAVARVATRHGLPFAVLRAVCDPADRTLTPAALAALDARGGIAIPRILRALLRQPGELAPLLALARDAAAARKSLVGRVREIGLRGGLMG